MSKTILPGKTIGILGGGQLGRMMALKAREMGYRITVLEPKSDSPCGQVSDHEVISPYDDREGAKELAERSDVITYEFENITHETAEWLKENAYLPQGSKLLQVTQDRKFEKNAILEAGVEVAPFREVNSIEDLENSLKELGTPAVLKTRRGGYDGKGQVVIKSDEDMQAARELSEKAACILEKWVPFEKEISVIVTRSTTGEITTFPVGENIHVDNILHQTIVPARVGSQVIEQAEGIAIKLAKAFEMIGTLAVEMFLTEDGSIYVNELAPRPHNSGHYTMEACETSQFEQHVRAVCGLPLGSTELLKPVVMVNILGEHLESVLEKIQALEGSKLHLYGKDEAKPKRKMGHINVLAPTVEEALEKINQLKIWQTNEQGELV
ncbi:5-(carboxyamino)imidazole ribonucleotide synthase [Pseudalkalibacillus caeni]|uniref:N5-carboxyaminoimidazole ribonucleotide synthase n=1 Tax=Exobacillus caeni TaxID=2574798 RepID=A0A5R9EXR5_9BACL|nr:5-(carboxyamino)imidazole ribonucleotide synthase [Pseudalkalibacillus caeni]TLS34966.1 5-(carboxyamino)imidazole ribonucleotide synthase [Pseudalkalibacillus caeni]